MVRTALDAGGFGYVLKSSAESELLAAVEAVMLGQIFVSDQLASRDFKQILGTQASIQSVFEESIESAAPPVPVDNAFGHSHEVEFYRNDASFLDRCTRFMGTALANGDSVILVATLSHGNSLRQRLEAEGYNVAEATERGRYLALEPACLLSEFLANGQPDSARYIKSRRTSVATALKAATGKRPRVAACGESLPSCTRKAEPKRLLRWNGYRKKLSSLYDVDILCGYPMVAFRTEEERSIFRRICAEHSAVYSR